MAETIKITPEDVQERVQSFLQQSLTIEEKEKIEKLGSKIEPLLKTQRLKQWCDERTLLRYLRARSWDISKAYEMLVNSIQWRMQMKPESITADQIKGEMNNKGKMYLHKSDKTGRPILYMKPGLDNTGPDQREAKIKYLVYMMEHASKRFDEEPALSFGASKVVLVIDYKDTSFTQLCDPRNFGISKEVLDILQNQYPERLGNAFIVNPPWIFSQFWKVIYPMIDPVTKEKIKLWSDKKEWKTLLDFIDEEVLETYYGGKNEYVYDFEKYLKSEDEAYPTQHFEDDDLFFEK